jgi:integrase/recombinase XerC
MCPRPTATSLSEQYDLALVYARDDRLPAGAPRPLPTRHWPEENIEFLKQYREWLLGGGVSELVTNNYHLIMAGHVLGLTLKPYHQLDPDADLQCALEYIKAKGLSREWTKNCRLALVKLRRYLRLQRGLGEESRSTPFDVRRHTQGLPGWVVNELGRYQHLLQRNWRDARIDINLRAFWNKHGRMWHFFCEERGVKQLADLKRQFVLDYLDARLGTGHAVKGVNSELRIFHTFLLFLQEQGYTVPNSLLRIPGLKVPDSLPKYLTDEQVRRLRDEVERRVSEAQLASRRRLAILVRAAFYLLWQGGLRLGELEELRLEDLDLGHKRLSVRDGKGRKDRTVYLAQTAIRALQEYMAVRGEGSADHVFLYRNAPMKKDLIRARLKDVGERVGVRVYPHRLRHTCATQLLNAGCRITSIQRFLGHKDLSSTMIYAHAHDQTVADDYFTAMERVEQRLDIRPAGLRDEVVKVQEVSYLIEQLELPELCLEERLGISSRLRQALGRLNNQGQLKKA